MQVCVVLMICMTVNNNNNLLIVTRFHMYSNMFVVAQGVSAAAYNIYYGVINLYIYTQQCVYIIQ